MGETGQTWATRYRCEPIAAVWTEHATLQRWERLWLTHLDVLGVPVRDVVASLERYHELEDEMGHDVAAALEAYREALCPEQPEAARWLGWGLVSSDTADAGWLTGIAEVTELITIGASGFVGALSELGSRTPAQVAYRTHGRDAIACTGGARWFGHKHRVIEAVTRVNYAEPRTVGLNGPIGTGGVLTDAQRRVIADRLGLVAGPSSGLQAADRLEWAHWLSAVAELATCCERFGTEVRLLAHTGVDEVAEGRGAEYRGSSSMPHKYNPTRSERLCGLAPVVRGLAAGYHEAASSHWGAHSLEHSAAERICIPTVTELVGYTLVEATAIARELELFAKSTEWNAIELPDTYRQRSEAVAAGETPDAAYRRLRLAAPHPGADPSPGSSTSGRQDPPGGPSAHRPKT